MSAPTREPGDSEAWIASLLERVAAFLCVPTRPIHIEISKHAEFVAKTRQCWGDDTPTIVLSPDNLRVDVVAHELTHCLVPSHSLFLAEGFATWVGCSLAGTCEHLLFVETTLDAVLRRHWCGSPAVAELLCETVGNGRYLAPECFSRLDGRVAHAVAGSFCGHWHRQFPALAASAASAAAPDPATLLTALTSLSIEQLAAGWLSTLEHGRAQAS